MEKRDETLPTPYPDLNSVLRDLVEGIRAVLSSNFVIAYLQGSFAVGDFDLHSDVDFIPCPDRTDAVYYLWKQTDLV